MELSFLSLYNLKIRQLMASFIDIYIHGFFTWTTLKFNPIFQAKKSQEKKELKNIWKKHSTALYVVIL
jgi:hypothetical protein